MALAEKALKVRRCFVGEGVNLKEGREQLQHIWLNSIELSALFVGKKYSGLDLFVKVKLRWGYAQKLQNIGSVLNYVQQFYRKKISILERGLSAICFRQKQKMENICLPNQISGKVRGSVVVQGKAASRGRGLGWGDFARVRCRNTKQSAFRVLFCLFLISCLFQIWTKRIKNMKIQP